MRLSEDVGILLRNFSKDVWVLDEIIGERKTFCLVYVRN